ncbi:MAG: hypothetical protein QXN86_04090, partial [Candidatus Methanomethylicaceae archaeon]
MREESSSNIIALLLIVFIAGAYIGYSLSLNSSSQLMSKVESLQSKISSLESKINALQSSLSSFRQNNTTLVSPSLYDLYDSVKASVVMIKGLVPVSDIFGTTFQEVLGSGFIVNLTGTPLIVTNYHVVENMVQGSV